MFHTLFRAIFADSFEAAYGIVPLDTEPPRANPLAELKSDIFLCMCKLHSIFLHSRSFTNGRVKVPFTVLLISLDQIPGVDELSLPYCICRGTVNDSFCTHLFHINKKSCHKTCASSASLVLA